MKNIVTSITVLTVILTLICTSPLSAQESIDEKLPVDNSELSPDKKASATASGIMVLKALRISTGNTVTLDGKLDESLWDRASVATGFTQRSPRDGRPASEETEVRMVYTDEALYIGATAYDSAMDSVAATLFRKDGRAYSDWFYVNIDSYNDNRTGFSFAVNPRGVRKDILTYNDNNEDLKWDAVWEASTQMNDDSWTVEIKIPLSQLRFNTSEATQSWGVNFQRRIARKDEISFWSPTPQNASGFVSNYGVLEGIQDLSQPRRLEVMPYVSGSLTRAPLESDNPFYQRNQTFGSVGADIKYGLTSDLTLTAAINPDFGQVEADPAQINLSAFETFFPEQRSFFLEGTDIFEFGIPKTYSMIGNPFVFYSRRIGRQPQGGVSQAGINANYVDRPDQTTIASAVKLSGKTQNGLSVGVLNAFTTRESADYQSGSGQFGSLALEPPTNYFVGRLKKDLNGGKTTVGTYASAVNRFSSTEYLSDLLHESAYIAGVDFEQSWKDREWILSGAFSSSSVQGSSERMQYTQMSSARYFNRPDADYLSVDPDRTSLQGYAGIVSFGRFAGDHWRGSVSYSVVSPGYEVNDIGFGKRSDYQGAAYYLRYQENSPKGIFRSYNIAVNKYHLWNYGGDQIENGYNLMGSAQFKNLWRFNLNSGYNPQTLDDRLLRGGPLALKPSRYYVSAVVSTNKTQNLSFDFGHLRGEDREGGYQRDLFVNMTYRPTSYIQIEVKPNYNVQRNTRQYVQAIGDPAAISTYGKRYVFADLDQTTLSAGIRLDWTFSPNMSLQTYLRPFITSGDFQNYKEFSRPEELEFTVYGQDGSTIDVEGNLYTVDPDGAGPASSFTFGERDFNFRSVQTNAVFRWEYRPGSSLYLVWQQDRSAVINNGDLRFQRDINGLFDAKPTNVFLVKFSYWLSK